MSSLFAFVSVARLRVEHMCEQLAQEDWAILLLYAEGFYL